jgi:hypothetical protein
MRKTLATIALTAGVAVAITSGGTADATSHKPPISGWNTCLQADMTQITKPAAAELMRKGWKDNFPKDDRQQLWSPACRTGFQTAEDGSKVPATFYPVPNAASN